MSFLYPLSLLAALGLALPILAHLLNRFQVNRTDWAAMQFLNRSVRVRSRQLRLRDILLLCLRCLAVLLLALAFARPFADSGSAWSGLGERRAGVVLAVDTSFSMQHEVDGVSRFAQAIEKLERIADTITPGDPVSLILLGEGHEVVARNMAYDTSQFATMLHDLEPRSTTLEVESIPERLAELCDAMAAKQKEVYLVTDLQARDWRRVTPWLRQSLKALSGRASVFVVPVRGDAENLAITDLELVSGVLRKGATTRYRATVQNTGTHEARNVRIDCQVNGINVDSKSIPHIAPGATETVSFFVPFNNDGPARIEAMLSDDALPLDNHRRTVAMIRDKVSVLVVQGTSGDATRQSHYLLDALRARGGDVDTDSLQVASLPWTALAGQNLEQVDVLIFSDVPEITEQQADQLQKFVRSGKGLVWLGGDGVKAEIWNRRSGAPPLLPGVLGPVERVRDDKGLATALDTSLSEHSVCRPLRSLPEDLLSETRFNKLFRVQLDPGAKTVLSLAGSKTPLLIEQSLGRGSVFMFTGPVQSDWNNLALTPAFPMLMQQIVTYLTGREFEKPREVGDSLSLIYEDEPDASDAVFETPSEKIIKVPVREHRGQYVALLDRARETGFYTARVSVQTPGTPVAVNVNPGESHVRCLTPEEAEARFAETGLHLLPDDADLSPEVASARSFSDFSRLFLLAGLILLLAECLLADRLLRRRTNPSTPAQPAEVS